MTDVVVPYEVAIADAGRVIAEGLQRQRERPAREAAVAALGRHATEAQIAAYIARFRTPRTAAPSAVSA